jgi:hypothetical protein
MRKHLILLSLVATVFTGCSTFHKDWKAASRQPVAPNDISGAWDGTWRSDFNNHSGRLRCIMTETGAGTYDARFRAKYKKILSFEYTVPLRVVQEGNSFRFEGEADLGKLAGGVYTYKGAANSGTFFSTYDSKYDHGKFEMKRPQPR